MSNDTLMHIQRLLTDSNPPSLEGEFAESVELTKLHDDILTVREILTAFANDDFSVSIEKSGVVFDNLRTLQEHINSIFILMQLVEQGNFSQQYPLTNSFSIAFNRMMSQFDSTLSSLKDEEKASQERESHLKYLADHDPLTGLMNRRAFMEKALGVLKMAVLKGVSCGIVMIDIDFFKKFNDTYGHLAGDEALKHFVEVISRTMRKDDFLGRYGGEEFVFFFCKADKKTGIAIAERLRETLAHSPVLLDVGPVSLTASFGVAMASDVKATTIDEKFIENLIHNADIALYQAKNTGRNKVVAF
ncbi:MAG: GGDEF domain-containing protein [Treponema sp.]|jgi:diguanylate cyclase (GGDEF)-like protein|nr:GGDEF domain-containing protein [Treponema sp.]